MNEVTEKIKQFLENFALKKGTRTFTLNDLAWHIELSQKETFEIASHLALQTSEPIELVFRVVCPKNPSETLFEMVSNQYHPVAHLGPEHHCSSCHRKHPFNRDTTYIDFRVEASYVQELHQKRISC